MTVINPGGGATAGVTTFNTRNGAVTLAKADVTGTGLAAADVSAAATASNGSDFANAATVRTNLGLGSLATSNGPIASFLVLTSDMGTIASQTTLQNITGLGVTIGASATEVWLMEWWILFTAANQTMDIKFGFTVPASCTLRGGPYTSISSVNGWDTVAAATVPIALVSESTTSALGTGTALQQGIPIAAVVFGGGTGGTVQPQYAQNTSDAGTLQILKGSCCRAVKLVA